MSQNSTELQSLVETSEQLCGKNVKVTPGDLAVLLPHLTVNERVKLLADLTPRAISVAGPPAFVHGCVRVYGMALTPDGPRIWMWFAPRVIERSYLNPRAAAGPSSGQQTVLGRDQLLDASYYALTRWGELLQHDNWIDVIQAMVLMPGNDAGAAPVITLTACLQCRTADLFRGDFLDYPLEVAVSTASERLTGYRLGGRELLGDRLPWACYFCGVCGNGIAGDVCLFCHAKYAEATAGTRPTTNFPLTLSMLLEIGDLHKFQIDPIEARKAHARAWAKSDFNVAHTLTHRERIVDLGEG